MARSFKGKINYKGKEKEGFKIDFIPTFHFIISIGMFGLLFYVYNPVVTYLNEAFPTSGIYSQAMFWLWGALAAVNLFISGIRLVMKYQQRGV